ncbi:MAG TPA: hypothetical protein VLT16_00510 [Candidatus Limnocylindrales bacterium]|nr:hypothetical protein [Candidatus Limnocylindrales bacterium]
MTEAQQKRFYFPAWNACARVNDWRMVQGRLVADLRRQRAEAQGWPETAREVMLQVLDYAEQLAAQEHRAATAADLRHACNLVATQGRRSSSEDLDNKQTNRVVVLFKLLQEPEDLDAIMGWLHPEESDRKGLANFIRKQAPEATLVAIAKHAFGTIFWEDLEHGKLKWLLKQVKGRQQEWHAKVAKDEEGIEQPF